MSLSPAFHLILLCRNSIAKMGRLSAHDQVTGRFAGQFGTAREDDAHRKILIEFALRRDGFFFVPVDDCLTEKSSPINTLVAETARLRLAICSMRRSISTFHLEGPELRNAAKPHQFDRFFRNHSVTQRDRHARVAGCHARPAGPDPTNGNFFTCFEKAAGCGITQQRFSNPYR